MTSYPCILADPPWPERGGGKIKRGADAKYKLLGSSSNKTTAPQIFDVMLQAPCWTPADDAHLWLWVTNNYLQAGLWLMGELGFRYITNSVWAKMQSGLYETRKRGLKREPQLTRLYQPQPPGLGQYIAGQHELLLFGVRGKLPAAWKKKPETTTMHQLAGPGRFLLVTRVAKRPGTLLLAPRREHSRKPEEAYQTIENVSPGPRLEMFARGDARPGWTSWGNEVK